MSNSTIRPKQLQSLKEKFEAFLQSVSLRSDKGERRRGSDGLIHAQLRFLADGSAEIVEPNRRGSYSSNDGKFLSLRWDDDQALEKLVFGLQRLCPNVSNPVIRETSISLMKKLFDEQVVGKNVDINERGELDAILGVLDVSNLEQELTEVVQWLRSQAVPQVVYVPVEGLKVSGSLTIGNVELHSRDPNNELDRLLESVKTQLGEGTAYYAHEALQKVSCHATVRVTGDDRFVRDYAVQRVTEALHILRLCIPSSMHHPSWARIAISSIILNRRSPTDNLENDPVGLHDSRPSGREKEVNQQSLLDVIGPAYDRSFATRPSWERNWQRERDMVNQSLARLSTCFQGGGEIAQRVKRAVTWYGKAVDAGSSDEQFVSLAIALESLLIGNEGQGPYVTTGSIGQTLGERVAFLLEDDFEGRHRKVKETRDLYALRGAIVHRGEAVTPEQLAAMEKLVKEVILTFVRHNFESWNKFQEWVARQKFERKVEPQPPESGNTSATS